MTTRNFRVNNGLSVGDIVIDATTNKITGLSTSAPSANGDVATKKYVDDSVSALSSNSINQGDSNVTVTDTGTGSVTLAADGSTYLTVAAAGITLANTVSMTSSNKNVTLSPTGTGTVTISPAGGLTMGTAGVTTTKQGNIVATTNNQTINLSPTGTGTVTISPAGTLTMGTAGATHTMQGNISAITNNQTINLSPTGTGSVTISPAGNVTIAPTGNLTLGSLGATATFSGNVRVTGDFTIDGMQTIINTTVLSVEDNIIELNRNNSTGAMTPTFSGIKISRGEASTATEQDVFWVWDNSFKDDGSSGTQTATAGGAWTAIRSTSNNSPKDSMPNAINSNNDSTLVDIRCNVIYATATAAQYADIAERFAADAPITPGAVVMFGGSQEITETAEELSDRVFGVVSTQPAYMMNSSAGNNESHPFVAMTGRTPVRVIGTVNKGDRLVSSSVKGTARAAKTSESINPFHVIGRALESKSDTGIGLVNCFVQAKN